MTAIPPRPDPIGQSRSVDVVRAIDIAPPRSTEIRRPASGKGAQPTGGRPEQAILAEDLLRFVEPPPGFVDLPGSEGYRLALEEIAGSLDADASSDGLARWGAAILRHELRKHDLLSGYVNGLIGG
ncbi:MAG TPA: hypothetical protein VFO41_15105 [Alphaproteobacteria bacterium]|nr:hypothetical protein [Alphaproteobacteria bacterium]